VGVTELDRQVECGWCGTRCLVEGLRFVPEYFVEPAVDADDARRTLQRLLARRGPLPRRALGRSRFRGADLHFVPYNDVSARRTGTMVLDARIRRPPGQERRREGPQPDTRVIFGGIHRVSPAVRLPGWSLEQAALTGGTDVEVIPRPMERAALAGLGRVLHPEIEPDAGGGSGGARSLSALVEDDTEVDEIRVRRIYYPVWRLAYEYQGRSYFATVDGLTGALMGARAPQGDAGRVVWLLATAMLLAFPLGGFLRTMGGALVWDSPAWGLFRLLVTEPLIGVPLLGTVGLLLLVAAAVAWEQYRYPGEVVFRGDRFEVEKIGVPPDNPIMTLAARLSDLLSGGFARWRDFQ